MDNTAPFELVAAPFTLWAAPVGTAFPDVDEAPGGSWTKIGTSGELNYDEEGVTVEHGQELNYFRALGSTGPRKAFRTSEDLKIRMTLHDVSMEQYTVAMNHNAITTTAAGSGTPGTKKIGLSRGLTVQRRALLVRGPSPYADDMAMQYEVPIAVQSAAPQPVFQKDGPAGLALEFTAIEDPSAANEFERFGRVVAQHQVAI